MHKRMLWRDIALTFKKSKGRFLSIVALLALGAFALVGFKVTGPDMRATAEHYFAGYHMADVTVIGDMGLDDDDEAHIERASGIADVEYGYLKDVTVTGTHDAIRVWSKPERLSEFEVVEGRLPDATDEIAVDQDLAASHPVGSTIDFTEKEATDGSTAMVRHEFTVVGVVKSVEVLSDVNRGITQAGTGDLAGYAVVMPDVFDVDYHMVARLAYSDTADLDPYSHDYLDRIAAHKSELEDLLADQPEHRLAAVQAEYQDAIDEGQAKVDDAKQQLSDAKNKLDDAASQIADAHDQIADSEGQLEDAAGQLADGRDQLDASWDQLAAGKATLDDSAPKLAAAESQLRVAATQLADGRSQLAEKQAEYDSGAKALADARSQAEQQAASAQAKIDDGRKQLADAKAQAAAQAKDAQAQIDAAKKRLDDGKAQYETKLAELEKQLAQAQDGLKQVEAGLAQAEDARGKLEAGISQVDAQLEALDANDPNQAKAIEQLKAQRAQLASQLKQAEDQRAQLGAKKSELEKAVSQVQAGIEQVKAAYVAFMSTDADPQTAGDDGGYNVLMAQVNAKQEQLDGQVSAGNKELADKQDQLDAAQQQLDDQVAAGNKQLAAKQAELDAAAAQLSAARDTLNAKQAEYDRGKAAYEQGVATYNEGLDAYYAGLAAWHDAEATLMAKTGEYEDGRAKLESAKAELADKEAEYQDGLAEYEEKLPDAQKEIADGEADLSDARATLAKLEKPSYNAYSRREAPGSEGYITYDSVSEIVDSLANIFPYFLYLVAALVASTTMTRMVDEERIGAGTLKALGYDDADVMRKFVVYGASAAVLGTVLGAALGHTLLPYIVYNAYHGGFTLPPIELRFNLGVSLACLALALVVAVVPAWLVARRELAEKPAALLLPKPPSAGSKILLERITPIWSRLSFMRKVTARNLFRYKKRSLMTIVGVAGAVSLMFTGFAVQHSIGGIATKQFGEIIGYDLIVAKNATVDDAEQADIDALLNSDDVTAHAGVTYEALTKTAGAKNDAQDITLLVPKSTDEFSQYLDLRNRETGERLSLDGGGAVISERLAALTGAKVGDTFTFKDADGVERSVRVSGICEMYMKHFMFMSADTYREVFGADAKVNAYVATLADNSLSNTQDMAAKFMALAGVKGVVQSTTIIDQIGIIVNSLNKIMGVLIVVAILLAVVIIYNLVTINVSERIRELSTVKVLGFFDGEVSMYIYRETIVLSAIGVPVGWALGRALQLYIINAVPPEEVMFNPATGWLCFVVPAVVVAVVVAGLYVVVKSQLRRVDMLEALKSVD